MGFITGIHRANSGIKQWTLFQQAHGLGNDIQCATTVFKHPLAGFNDIRQRLYITQLLLLAQLRTGDSPCACCELQ